jgi:alanyl-tRNA synthetase
LKSRQDAIAEGAMALFGEKYGETVRTITIAPADSALPGEAAAIQPTSAVEHQEKYSYELCGGTHLERTSDIGAFLIASEGSAAAGVRRIEAVTGRGAYDLIARRSKALKQAAGLLKSGIDEVPLKLEALQAELAELRRQASGMRSRMAQDRFGSQLEAVQTVKGVAVLASAIPDADADTLRSLADKFREKHPKNGVCVLASVSDGKSTLIAAVTEDLVKRGIKAGDIIAGIGGRGGGRPNLAQGSLPDGTQPAAALGKVAKAVEALLK